MNVPRRILAIDDDPNVLSLMEDILADEYRVLATSDPAEALSLLEREKPDLVIVDLGLPEIGGDEMVRRIRAHPQLQDLPIVVVSAFTGLRRRVSDLHVQAVIRKPFHLDEFMRTMHDLLSPHQQSGSSSSG